jgi:hypothetical protein
MPDSLRRLAPLTGVVFAVLLAVTFILTGDTPGQKDTGQQVISFYQDHHGKILAGNLFGAVGVPFFIFFVATLRGHLSKNPGGEVPSTMALVGATMIAIGGATFASLEIGLSDVRNDISPAAAQAINVLDNVLFIPFEAGIVLFGIGAGLAILNGGGLPRWLGWVAFVLGVIAFTPVGFLSFIVFLLWSAVVGIMIFRSQDSAPAPGDPVGASA